MITVYGFSRVTAFAHGRTRELRVLWALEEMGLPYRIEGLDHPAGDTATASFHALNPFGQVPAIEDDGARVSESGAILLHLARTSGRLMPTELAAQDQVVRWCFAALSTIELPMILLDVAGLAEQGGREAGPQRDFARQLAHTRLADLERWLEGREFIATAQFTIADILMAHVLLEQREKESALFEPYPRVRGYRDRCLARPAWQKVIADYRARVQVA